MGIPKFFKWLTRRYPLILQSVKYEEDVPPVDNLYLDINGIVHNCIHGNDKTKHERMSRLDDLEEVWANIMRAIDEIVHTVKPRKLILLAVDGVAPRAKMNQQRERRFRSAKDAADLRERLEAQGRTVPEVFDTNQISPGTDFMHELGRQLEWFVKHKLNTDPLYQECAQVVLSDSSVPGEGEHKMLDYIRNAKMQEGYDPNTRHCFYGADADLIMLSLLTHEPHFMIIREEHVVRKSKHGGVQRIDIERTSDFQLIHISLLREYFFLEYRTLQPQMRMRFDIERIIDDFVFFCFFIGNDFLPSLSALDISEGSLDHLIAFYKKYLPEATDYITDNGLVHWDRAEPFIGLLGKYEHQVFVNRVKTIQKQYADGRNVMTFGDGASAQMGKLTAGDRTRSLQETLQTKIKAKKLQKCKTLHQNKKQKKYKKFLLLKRFEELDPDEGESVPAAKRAYHAKQMEKFRGLMQIQLEQEQATAELGEMSLSELVGDLKEQYLSDLNPEEIPNSEISDVSEGELEADPEAQKQQQIELQKSANAGATERAIESNHTFMLDFVNTYKRDSNLAKRNYYKAKLKFDVGEPRGKRDLHKLLYRYIEGLQWVLFYYYRGSQHWRWYYPYHYAPMISDLGCSIVNDFLNGATTITAFRTDTNCNADPTPYTPFQQLLCILPIKSMRAFLPAPYAELAAGPFAEYFPASFEIDLNGRTLPWEAHILIPFVDEDLFLSAERELLDGGKLALTDRERTRNVTSFVYPYYTFDPRADGGKLPSSLTTMRPQERNKAVKHLCHDYERCGTASFSSKLLPGVVRPQPGFPSLDWLRVADLDFRDVFVQKVAFKQALAVIPKCKEDYSAADFEAYIGSLAASRSPELYVDFPWQIEASPVSFEDAHYIYQVYHDPATGMQVAKSRNPKSPDEFRHQGQLLANDLERRGFAIDVDNTNAFVSYNALNACEYDENQDAVFKLFKEEAVWLPLSMVSKKRDPSHYLNINGRVEELAGRIRKGQDAIIFHQDHFGVVGRVKSKDMRHAVAVVAVDGQAESAKLHHPFLVENFLRREFTALKAESLPEKGSKKMPSAEAAAVVQGVAAKLTAKRYFGDQEIEVVLGLRKGVVNRLTSSFLVAFDEPGKDERQVIDLGLNLKNFTKKVHVAEFVRFIAPGAAANTVYDDFNHDRAARGSKHVRKHWEYSQDCFDVIKEYVTKFPEILDAIAANQKHNKGMNSLFDLYPKLSKADKSEGIAGARAITTWIEALPISKLPYVEMGFDALDSAIIGRLQDHIRHVQDSYEPVNVSVGKKNQMEFQTLFLYQEMYPHWFSPYLNRQRIGDFRVGNRVMNLNSTLRQYIPFGLRGTVVGKTEDYVIVLFDEQFLHGTDVNGHCENYRGAKVVPLYLMNLSRSFAQLAKDAKNYNTLKAFQERPKKGEVEFEDQMSPTEVMKRKTLREAHEVLDEKIEAVGRDEKEEVPVEKTKDGQGQKHGGGEERKASENTGFDANAPVFKPKGHSAVWQPKQDQIGKVTPAEVGVAEKKEPAVRQRQYGLGQPKPKPQMPQKKTPQMPGQTIPAAPLKEIGTKAEPVARLPSDQTGGEEPQAGKFLFKPLNMNIKGLSDKQPDEEEKKGPE